MVVWLLGQSKPVPSRGPGRALQQISANHGLLRVKHELCKQLCPELSLAAPAARGSSSASSVRARRGGFEPFPQAPASAHRAQGLSTQAPLLASCSSRGECCKQWHLTVTAPRLLRADDKARCSSHQRSLRWRGSLQEAPPLMAGGSALGGGPSCLCHCQACSGGGASRSSSTLEALCAAARGGSAAAERAFIAAVVVTWRDEVTLQSCKGGLRE